MEDQGLYQLLEEGESLLYDIFLSGFHSVSSSTVEKCQRIEREFARYGMETGAKCFWILGQELLQRKNSFSYDIANLAHAYCCTEFYLKTAAEQIK